MTSTPAIRRHDLDWLRIAAFGLLIFYHIGMFYVSWDWHVKSVHAGPTGEWAMMLLNPWRLSLLFLISGVALRFALDTARPGPFARQRLARLGLPILFGMVVICAPQSWLQLVESGEISDSFQTFWPQYLDPSSEHSVTTPTWNHLWYVVYLLVYTMILAAIGPTLSRWAAGPGERVFRRIFNGRRGILAAMIIPFLPHALYRVVLDPYFPTTHDLTSDWANHAHSFTMLLTGYLLAKSPSFWNAVSRSWPFALGVAVAIGAALTPVWLNWETLMGENGALTDVIWPVRFLRVWYAWLAILSLLGLFQRYCNRDSQVLRYMTEAIFPWYILHQTLIIVAGFWLTRQGLPAPVEFLGVVLATAAGCALLHECLIRRSRLMRPLFGLKPARPWLTAARP